MGLNGAMSEDRSGFSGGAPGPRHRRPNPLVTLPSMAELRARLGRHRALGDAALNRPGILHRGIPAAVLAMGSVHPAGQVEAEAHGAEEEQAFQLAEDQGGEGRARVQAGQSPADAEQGGADHQLGVDRGLLGQ